MSRCCHGRWGLLATNLGPAGGCHLEKDKFIYLEHSLVITLSIYILLFLFTHKQMAIAETAETTIQIYTIQCF